MDERAVSHKYNVSSHLTVRLQEFPARKRFPKCEHCGQGHYWNVVWPSARVMSRFLATDAAELGLKGKRALVIGCGAGLESVVAAKMGAEVTVLDHSAEALRLTRENCILNGIDDVHTTRRCWLDRVGIARLRRFEVVLGCDVLYNIGKKEVVNRLLSAALKRGGLALFAEPERIGAKDPRRLLDGSGFQIEATTSRVGSDGVTVHIYRVRHREPRG
jgi:2-polyprenyl-3-methyl-5-hydroxy-6-metoxy-1,4-benzoquinol methylase